MKLKQAHISGEKRSLTISFTTQGLQALPPHSSKEPIMANQNYLVKYLSKEGFEEYKLATAVEALELTQPDFANDHEIQVLFIQPYR
jgi:hypothetical protein